MVQITVHTSERSWNHFPYSDFPFDLIFYCDGLKKETHKLTKLDWDQVEEEDLESVMKHKAASQISPLQTLVREPSPGFRYLCCGDGCGTAPCRTSAAFHRLPLTRTSPWFSQS